MGWVLHVLGIDTQQSYFYDWWSGFGTQIAPICLAIAWYRHNNCHRRRCPRLGKHQLDGTPYCTKHHPER